MNAFPNPHREKQTKAHSTRKAKEWMRLTHHSPMRSENRVYVKRSYINQETYCELTLTIRERSWLVSMGYEVIENDETFTVVL